MNESFIYIGLIAGMFTKLIIYIHIKTYFHLIPHIHCQY